VTFSSFTGVLDKDEIRLEWITATEISNAGFEIQRSRCGNKWESIGFVEGQGNSITSVPYFFTDQSPFPGSNYYRLKQLNFDETFAFSETVSVDVIEVGAITVYPNPTANYINWAPATPKAYELYNSNGKRVRVGEGTRIDIIGLSAGMYYLKLEGEKLRKIVVQPRTVYP
ncbi:MAG: T9SS type A sorting domain-containing protein, partial [Bacteroidota bacterium]